MSESNSNVSAADLVADGSKVRCLGRWTAQNIHGIERKLAATALAGKMIRFELDGLDAMDTSGAWLLHRTVAAIRDAGQDVAIVGADPSAERLLALVGANSEAANNPPRPREPAIIESIGRHTSHQFNDYLGFVAFVGRLATVGLATLRRPSRLRGSLVVREVRAAGLNALPIVGLLAFLLGIVIAYQGGIVLRDYGANVYVADIVGLSMTRELAPLITAIIVAGRTGSAYTAQIGTMIVTEEVDALKSIGIAPMEMLVLPKLIALMIALPLLTVFADAIGIVGGMVMAGAMLNLNPATYVDRLGDALTLESYLSGIGKTPVFAAIISAVGCFRGFEVFGSAVSVGRQTTISVVQSIFLVIIIDAVFSVAFSKLGI